MPVHAAAPQPASAHLQELRRRLSYCVGVLLIGGTIGYLLRGPVIVLLRRPLGEQLFYTSPTGSFDFIMQVCLLVGLLLSLPVFCYHLLRFIEPALPRALGFGRILRTISASYGLALGGVAFAYFVSLPAALHFFTSVGTNNLHALISVNQYFQFVLGYLGAFALIFQLPLALLFINSITPLGPSGLSKWRKWVVIASFGLAIILPITPDPLSQVVLALPIVLLYELSIWLVRLANHRRPTRPAPTTTVAPITPSPALPPAAPPLARPVTAPPLHPGVLDLRPPTLQSPSHAPQAALHVLDLRSHNS